MPLTRKETAWRKNRRFSEVHGGRKYPKIPDRIMRRVHSLSLPASHVDSPTFLIDNPSRSFFFPVGEDEIRETLRRLPWTDTCEITHVWFRRIRKTDYDAGRVPFAEFMCGSGCRIIILYPWPVDQLLRFGKRRPSKALLKEYAPWTTDLVQREGQWCLRWTLDGLRDFYLKNLLLHEVGHHVDWYYRHWTAANRRQAEEEANQYAIRWAKRVPKQEIRDP